MTSRKAILLIITLWFHAVATLGYFGFTRASEPFVRGPLVAIGILAPYLCYLFWRDFRHVVDEFDVSTITALHAWRLYGGFVFLYCGSRGLLSQPFADHAGYAELTAGALMPLALLLPKGSGKYAAFHFVGLTLLLFELGDGVFFTWQHEPLLDNLFDFPLVLIPLFATCLGGASHLIVLHRFMSTGQPSTPVKWTQSLKHQIRQFAKAILHRLEEETEGSQSKRVRSSRRRSRQRLTTDHPDNQEQMNVERPVQNKSDATQGIPPTSDEPKAPTV